MFVVHSREKFGEVNAKLWWEQNRDRIQAQYLWVIHTFYKSRMLPVEMENRTWLEISVILYKCDGGNGLPARMKSCHRMEWNGMDQPPHPNGITVICGDDSNLLPCRLCSRWWNFGFNVTTSNIFHFLYLFGLNLIDKEFTIIYKNWPCFPRVSLFFRASWNFSASESICLFLAAVL